VTVTVGVGVAVVGAVKLNTPVSVIPEMFVSGRGVAAGSSVLVSFTNTTNEKLVVPSDSATIFGTGDHPTKL
jgi:hypothetical protein